jgi:hypothetical protein
MTRTGLLLLAAVLAGCGAGSGPPEQRSREDEFRKTMTGATFAGRFSSNKSDRLSGERYTVSSVTKLAGDLWTINARIQYGSHDVTVPVPMRVLWAGDTPVLTMTDAGIPGMGKFTARVLIYRDQYAGTWSSDKGSGGQLFGRLERSK